MNSWPPIATMPDGYLLDANLLLALYDPRHLHHTSARAWFERVEIWATTPITEAAFVRLVSNPAVSGERVSPGEALGALDAIRHAPGHRFLTDDSSLAHPHIGLGALVGYRQVTDFHLVNLAARAGIRLATFDARLAGALDPADRPNIVVVPA